MSVFYALKVSMLIPEACAAFSIFNPKQNCLLVFCFKNGSCLESS